MANDPAHEAPAVQDHTDACRVLLFHWRMRNAGLPAVDDVAAFPCSCTGGRVAWRLVEAPHPPWCRVSGSHPWTQCTITQMIPKEAT